MFSVTTLYWFLLETAFRVFITLAFQGKLGVWACLSASSESFIPKLCESLAISAKMCRARLFSFRLVKISAAENTRSEQIQ